MDEILHGITVVDLSEGIPGAVATRLLAETGAAVVKVERPGGDPLRRSAPAGFATWNRSKVAVSLDIGEPSGLAALHELLNRADVLVHAMPASRARWLGLDEASLAREHPQLIVGSVPAYPDGHPRAGWDVPDSLIQAREGVMDEQQGNRDGPIRIRMPFPSWCAVYLLATGVLARLIQRERTGLVAPAPSSVFQGALVPAALYWQRSERLPEGIPGHTLTKHYPDAALAIFECADGQWIQLAGAMGGWIESPPVLETLAERDEVELSEVGVTPENRQRWQAVFRCHDAAHWVERFAHCDVPCMRIRDLGDCFTDEQVRANEYVVEVTDPVLGLCLQAGPPVQTSPPGRVHGPAPRLGASTVDETLTRLGPARSETGYHTEIDGAAAPLAGIRALDFGSMVAGPFGAQCLADLGAEVIKVEPLAGDRGRGLTQFAGSHRRKRSLALDLKAPAGRAVLRELVSASDVVLHNMRLAPAARLGLDGPGLRAVNPRIVFSHVSAYGTKGRLAGQPGYDPTAQALTGWERANVGPGMPPMWLRNSIMDIQAGLAGCLGALLQLYHRERTGVAADATTSLAAVGITMASETAVSLPSGRRFPVATIDPDQTGTSPTDRIYPADDGWIAVAGEDEATVLGILDPGTGGERRSAASLLAELDAAGIPAAPVMREQMTPFFDSEAHRTLGFSRRLTTLGYGGIDVVGGFWGIPQPQETAESIPALGEHSRAILTELGFSPEQSTQLASDGVIRDAAPATR